MATNLATPREAVFFDPRELPQGDFQACARYYEPMDFLLYLRDDLPYRADRVDSFLTLLWHPYQDQAIGVKLKGFRFLFERMQAIFRAQGRLLLDNDFLPVMSAVEVAMTAGIGSAITDGAERKRLDRSYALARTLTKSARFDPRELRKAA